MARGDHIKVSRGLYSHHGIDLGDGQVIHYSGEPFSKSKASICKVSKQAFAEGGQIKVVEYCNCDSVEVVIKRAESRLGEQGYSLLFNNCEHFARWCKTGRRESQQVNHAVFDAVISGLSAAVVRQLAKEAAKEAAEEVGKSALKQAVKAGARELVKEAVEEGTKAASRELVKRTGVALAKEVAKDTAREGAKGVVKEVAKDTAANTFKSALKSGAPVALVFGIGEQVIQHVRYANGEITEEEYVAATVGNIGSTGGSLGGAAIGTMICPGIGTVIGGILGGLFGGAAGRGIGESLT